ncbi:MAG: hypothetical protein AAF604_10130 [Acidobacteriota bacterium]
MPFEFTLANLLADTDRTVGVLFLDDSGETVDLACADYSPYDMKVVAAYLGIYLRQVRSTVDSAAAGELASIHISRFGLETLVQLLPDGYALALVQRPPVVLAQARRALERAADEIRREVFAAPQGA